MTTTPPPATDSHFSLLPPSLRIGIVHLAVSDLGRAVSFYQRVVGLQVEEEAAGRADLRVGGAPLLALTERPGARRVRHHAGLYHFALLVPTRAALARALGRLIETGTPFASADHLVSEALYLSDPDGNGIEIYRDRPREEWPFVKGRLQMDTLPLDLTDLLRAGEGADAEEEGLAPGTRMGHVHLHVSGIAEAERFYRDVMGFELMQRFGATASFLSAGGYHHHVAVNVWAGVGVPPAQPDAVGLVWFEIVIPETEERDRLRARLDAAGVPVSDRPESFFVRDPAGNGIVVRG
ncbi:MAG TPA: VOC family protein [Thermoanaerobaculia bacterium]|nr:VOC family protein [Thermoanaerobaculia bacterium]